MINKFEFKSKASVIRGCDADIDRVLCGLWRDQDLAGKREKRSATFQYVRPL